jgi:hypothetical protein
MDRLSFSKSATSPAAVVAVIALAFASIVFSQNTAHGFKVKYSGPLQNQQTATPNQGEDLHTGEATLFGESILRILWM